MPTPKRLIESGDGFEIVDNEADQRYEAWFEGQPAGLIEYIAEDGWLVIDHTEVLEAFEGKGIASRLAKAALDDVRARGLFINPQCPFVSSYIKRHAEYRDLVVGIRGSHG